MGNKKSLSRLYRTRFFFHFRVIYSCYAVRYVNKDDYKYLGFLFVDDLKAIAKPLTMRRSIHVLQLQHPKSIAQSIQRDRRRTANARLGTDPERSEFQRTSIAHRTVIALWTRAKTFKSNDGYVFFFFKSNRAHAFFVRTYQYCRVVTTCARLWTTELLQYTDHIMCRDGRDFKSKIELEIGVFFLIHYDTFCTFYSFFCKME